MAIEAITQMWECDGGEFQQVEAFELQNTVLKAALLVPEDDHGVEVLLNLHPCSLTQGSSAQPCYRFLITSVVNSEGKDLFVEHAYGQIRIANSDLGG